MYQGYFAQQLGGDGYGLGIKWEYIDPDQVVKFFTLQAKAKGKTLDKRVIGQISKRRGFMVWYEGKCKCKDGSDGEVVLVQKKKRGWRKKKWVYDAFLEPWKEKCKKTNKDVLRQPCYLDANPDTGKSGTPGNKKGSYVDSPTFEQQFKVEAWCRCPCEDDFPLKGKDDTITIDYEY